MIKEFARRLLRLRANRKISRAIKTKVRNLYANIDCSEKVKGESDYLEKWSDLMIRKDPYFYRLYSNLSGKRSPNHLPSDVYVMYILKLLNDSENSNSFRDKNFSDLIFSDCNFPETYFRNFNGISMDSDYSTIFDVDTVIDELLQKHDFLVIKPTVDTTSGKNVRLFQKEGDSFKDERGTILNSDYLDQNYRRDYIIQQAIQPSDDLSMFNTGSVNSLRMFVYRSVTDNKIKLLNAYLKVGQNGSFTDNLSSSGFAIRVSNRGKLGTFALNKFGKKVEMINDVDLKSDLFIESFEEVKKEVKRVAEKCIYNRFVGIDVTKDINHKPVILEANLGHIGVDTFGAFGYPMFGLYTDEIIDYCVANKHKLNENYNLNI